MKIYTMTFTKENHEKNKAGTKTNTRRVIEKIDQYKNIKPGDLIHVVPNRFTKKENYLYRLECLGSKVEPVQDIGHYDIWAEGIEPRSHGTRLQNPTNDFIELWDSINKDRGYEWATNPLIRSIKYKYIQEEA